MKSFKNFVNNNKKVQRILWSLMFTLMIVGLAVIIASVIKLNLSLITAFLLIVIVNYFLHKDVKLEL